MNKELNANQERLLMDLTRSPSSAYGQKATMKVLVKKHYAEQKEFRGFFHITAAGCEYLGVNQKRVDVAYAAFNLTHGIRLHHNVRQINTRFNGEYTFEKSWIARTMQEELEAVHDYHMRAIELARAEIRAGIAGK